MKTIVYLDQPFVSNLWKSTQGSYLDDQVWAELYEVLDRGVKKEGTIICPATRFHEPLQRIQENLKRGESASAVDKDRYESFRTLKTAYERFCPEEHKFGDFLTSEVLYEAPFIDVYCSIYAAMNVYLPNRKDKASDWDDVAILATAIPYCGVVTTDTGMKDICMRAGLHTKYGAEIFSPGLEDVRELIARLAAC